ncbi:acyl-CoA thioesterase [Algiphilus sp.]|uniref:acyl-CoA thioesterase n=1 Tax=Algiphilus sp. TaxID=1872431 RepID=UPI003B5301D4
MAPHRVSIEVRWGDMDALGHVNNARFFTYDEDVRLGFFNQLMAEDARFWKDYGLILAHIGCDFVAQVRAPATLDVAYGIARIGSKSFETRAFMYDQGVLAARTKAIVVWYDYVAQATLAIPDGVRQQLSTYLLPEQPESD